MILQEENAASDLVYQLQLICNYIHVKIVCVITLRLSTGRRRT